MSCPYYGKSALLLIQKLAPTGGNQCALVTGAHSPCVMEFRHEEPDLDTCERRRFPEASAFAKWPSIEWAEYPD
jgi:hypothetical protein